MLKEERAQCHIATFHIWNFSLCFPTTLYESDILGINTKPSLPEDRRLLDGPVEVIEINTIYILDI